MKLHTVIFMMVIMTTLCFLPNDLVRFQVIASSTITNSGSTVVHGDIALHPGSAVTGFPPGNIIGKMENL